MGFKCGIIGLPNVGKSTLFNALTKAGIQAENYPFCTIEPNIGIVSVPDSRMDALAKYVNPQKIISTTMEFVDIAGIVAGASKGEGLGNKFLANIRETDAIAHVVRCFVNEDIVHVAGKIDPIDDISTINTELLLADIESMEKAVFRVSKLAKGADKEAKAQKEFYEKLQAHLEAENPARSYESSDAEKVWMKQLFLLTAKSTLYIANVDEEGFDNNPLLDLVADFAKNDNASVVAICASVESEIAELEDDERDEFLEDLGLEEPGLNRVIRAGYELLSLRTYFTAGVKEIRAWTIHNGSTAPQAAAVIHTDFEKGFIRAEIIAYEDFVANKGEQGAKDAGKWRLEGKDYIVQDGDVVHFRFNV